MQTRVGLRGYSPDASVDDTEAGNVAGSGPTPPPRLEEPAPSGDRPGRSRGEAFRRTRPGWTLACPDRLAVRVIEQCPHSPPLLGIGLMLFCLQGLATHQIWKTGVLAFAFWAINVGLALMVLLSLLPVGLMQTWASVEHGTWYARSAEFMQTSTMETLRWLRIVGDTIFAAGMVALGWFVVGLKTGWSITGERDDLTRPFLPTAVAEQSELAR